ncbi:porin [Bordetella trematum]|uniref:Outer membrane porin protein n=1 Tax=Bordetella trematum TaxID=123899 RepID=A0A157MEB6_9BORD|nr:porin [Bordetella trematum]AUL48760.1 porin [Bordetella trematum]AZR95698.1 porin [Bordetella trematum]NNH18879.1 porin [Bordetella trematum]QIM70675.1 porin [Bordetella trematum]CZZ91535.1 outer membrane porin protein [Bordetella trematum]
MKKTLLATALGLSLAGIAQAETSVTLYGVIDTGIGYNKIKGPDYSGSRVSMINGVQAGSRWGLRGSDELGDGLRAIFTLESGFDSGNGNSAQGGRLFGRQATIGVANDAWGSLEFGRQATVGSNYLADIDPFYTSYGQANMGTGFSAANTMRWDNMVMYRTPSVNGIELGVGYSFNVDSEDASHSGFRTADNTRGITAGVRYLSGPLNVTLTYDQLNGASRSSVDKGATPRQYAIGATYDFEVVKVAAAYGRTTDGWFVGQDLDSGTPYSNEFGSYRFADGFKANAYMVGATVPLSGASSLFGSWQRVDPSNKRLNGNDDTMNVFSLGYTYDLSKRTNVYAYGSYAKDYAFVDGLKSTAMGVGLRHRF